MSQHRSSLVWALTLGLCACSVDDRRLQRAPDGEAVAGTRSDGTSGAAPRAGAASEGEGGAGEAGAQDGGNSGGSHSGGSAGSASELVDGCADLDTDGVADCTVTLLENPTFGSDIQGWVAGSEARLTWDAMNALSDLPSGSVKLDSAARLSAATQCVSMTGQHLVIAYAGAFVEAADESSQVQLAVSFFAADDCSGEREGYFETPPSASVDAWTTLHAGGLSRATTGSVSIQLVGVKAVSALAIVAYFDNVMLKMQAP